MGGSDTSAWFLLGLHAGKPADLTKQVRDVLVDGSQVYVLFGADVAK